MRLPAVLCLLCVCLGVSIVQIGSGSIVLSIETAGSSKDIPVDLKSIYKSTIQLTQSSTIEILARISFTENNLIPEFVSFRLRKQSHQHLTQPAIALFDDKEGAFRSKIELADPKQIYPYSGDYKLEIIVADDRIQTPLKKYLANCHVTFKNSPQTIPPSKIDYEPLPTILTNPTAQRVDPPKIFTFFVLVVLAITGCIFLYGLRYLKVNIDLFPASSGGFILNLLFLVSMSAILVILFKFWLSWTLLYALNALLITIIPTALIANYAFMRIKKE